MAKEKTRDTEIKVGSTAFSVTMGDAKASAPLAALDDLIRALEAVRHLVGAPSQPGRAKAAAPAAGAGATRRATAVPSAEPSLENVVALAAAAPAAEEAPKKSTKKRRSRKRVGDALVTWMKKNPGWHSEDKLLEVVIENKMSDASPKRALKIALGKQRGVVFSTDDKGNWKLASDDAAPIVAPPAKEKKKKKRASKKGTKKAKGAKAVPAKRKTRLRTKKARAAVADEAPAAATGDSGKGESAGRRVLVKKGQDRRLAALPPGEKEAREEAATKAGWRNRWQRATPDEVERARRNLLGLGSAGTKVTTPEEGEEQG